LPSTPHEPANLKMRGSYLPFSGVVLSIAAALIAYSQTRAFAWDEGFHLLAAQLIEQGKHPYLDFVFPQTPLNAYWNAAWMRIFGQSWRVSHALSALMTSGAVMLASDYVYRRLGEPRWRTLAALFTAFTVGLNVAVFEYGTLGQAYGLCLFLIVAAFRASIPAVERRSLAMPLLAGLFSAAAAASSLLTAPVAPVLLIWMLAANRVGNRVSKLVAFVLGAVIGSAPVLWLFVKSPRQVIFGILQYHLFYRQVEWSGALGHDLEVAIGWIDYGPVLMLILLSVGGLWFVYRSDWERSLKNEFYLCVCLALAETIYLLNVHPTFSRYFLLTVPFLAIPAAVGLCAYGERLSLVGRPRMVVAVGCCLMAFGIVKFVYDGRDDICWSDMEEIAAKVDEVTPRGSSLYAEEIIYFLTRRTPPPGMEHHDAHKLKLPLAEAAALHVLPRPELKRMIDAGAFSTVETSYDDEIEQFDLPKLYSKKAEFSGGTVFWERK
jgi:hypothetical protein